MNKKVITILATTLIAANLTACSIYPTKAAVRNEVESYTQGEEVEEVKYKKDSDAMVFTYESKDRDLTFHMYGRPAGYRQLTTSSSCEDIYTPVITSDYVLSIHELYYDDVDDIIMNSGLTVEKVDTAGCPEYQYDIYCYSYDEVPAIVDVLMQANDVYAEELNYHDEAWLEQNRLVNVSILCKDLESGNKKWVLSKINGVLTAEEYTRIINRGLDTAFGQ